MKISVSYLSSIDNLDKVIDKLNNTSCDYLHCDIMDNIFVPNITPNYEIINNTLKNFQKKKDVHLMVKDVKKYVDVYKDLNPEYITFHLEAGDNIKEMINYIKSFNIKVGLSIKPNTGVDRIIPYLGLIDLVLVMSVEPGFGGQEFIIDSIKKVNELKEIKNNQNYNYIIEVDGGINNTNIDMLSSADMVVVGSYITKTDNYQDQINKILK